MKRLICRLGVLLLLLGVSPATAEESVKLRVSETAGIRRFGYPVSVTVPLPRPLADGEHLRSRITTNPCSPRPPRSRKRRTLSSWTSV